MENGITSRNVGKKSVAQSLTFRRPFHQAGNVDHIQKCRNFAAKEEKKKKSESV
jgi:hypothetical protein